MAAYYYYIVMWRFIGISSKLWGFTANQDTGKRVRNPMAPLDFFSIRTDGVAL